MNLVRSTIKKEQKSKQTVFAMSKMGEPECTCIQTELEIFVLEKKCLKNTTVSEHIIVLSVGGEDKRQFILQLV